MEQRRSSGRVRSVSARVAGYGPRALSALALLLAVSLTLGATSMSMHYLSLGAWGNSARQTDTDDAAIPLFADQDGSGQINPAPDAATAPPAALMSAPTTPSAASGAQLSREQAIALVQKRYRAQVVRTTTQDEKGRRVFVFRLLSVDSGKVWTVRIDAQTGAELP